MKGLIAEEIIAIILWALDCSRKEAMLEPTQLQTARVSLCFLGLSLMPSDRLGFTETFFQLSLFTGMIMMKSVFFIFLSFFFSFSLKRKVKYLGQVTIYTPEVMLVYPLWFVVSFSYFSPKKKGWFMEQTLTESIKAHWSSLTPMVHLIQIDKSTSFKHYIIFKIILLGSEKQ